MSGTSAFASREAIGGELDDTILRKQCIKGDTKFRDALMAAGYLASQPAAPVELATPSQPEGEPSPEPTIDELKEEIKFLEAQLIGCGAARITLSSIILECCKFYKVKRDDFLSERRFLSLVRPRQVSMYLCRHLTSRSLPEIGRRHGNRDHTTVLYAIRKLEALMEFDTTISREVELIRKRLELRQRQAA